MLDRVRRIYGRNLLLGVTVVTIAACIYMAVAPYLFGAFSTVGPVVAAASRQVRLLALTFVGVSVAIVSSSAFQATGRPMPALVLSLVRMGLVSLPIAFALELWLDVGINGVFVALAAGNLVAGPLSMLWVRRHLGTLTFRSVSAQGPKESGK
jgi:Na+-driven multidrug efflux pump